MGKEIPDGPRQLAEENDITNNHFTFVDIVYAKHFVNKWTLPHRTP